MKAFEKYKLKEAVKEALESVGLEKLKSQEFFGTFEGKTLEKPL